MSHQPNTTQFENNDFKIFVENQPHCQIHAKIEVSKNEANKAYKQAIKKINKEVSIPGFRKGKAPEQTVIKNYGQYIEQEWKEILVNDALRACFDLTKIYPLNKDSVQRPKIQSCSLETGATIEINYERYPELPPIDFSILKLQPIEQKPVTNEQVQEVLSDIQNAHANWEEISNRTIQEGDFVDLTIDAIDQEPARSIVKDRRFEVSEKKMVTWLRNLILGKNIGDVLEAYSELDEKADDEVKQKFIKTHCRVTIHAIKKIIPHEINEELAIKTGASSLDDLKNKIAANLNQEAEHVNKQKMVMQLEDALLAHYALDIPFSLLEAERRYRIKEKIRELKHQKVSDEEIKNQEKAIEDKVAIEATNAIRLHFLRKKIAEQGKITISNQELNQEVMHHISQNPAYFGKDTTKSASEELIAKIANHLMQRKVYDYSLQQVEKNS